MGSARLGSSTSRSAAALLAPSTSRPTARISASALLVRHDARPHAVVEAHLAVLEVVLEVDVRGARRRARRRSRSAPGRASSRGRSRRAASRPRTIASAPMRRSCELVPCRISSSRNSSGHGPRGQVDDLPHARDLGVEARRARPAASPGCAASRRPRAATARSRRARTGAPASASTALTPTVRSSVLLPGHVRAADDQQPRCSPPPSARRSRPRSRAGSSGWPSASASKRGGPRRAARGTASSGCSKA